MAVVTDDPLDIALDRLGSLISTDHADSLAGASAIAGLWHTVYDRAMDRIEKNSDDEKDVALALLAAREWCNAMRVIRSLIAATSPPPPL